MKDGSWNTVFVHAQRLDIYDKVVKALMNNLEVAL